MFFLSFPGGTPLLLCFPIQYWTFSFTKEVKVNKKLDLLRAIYYLGEMTDGVDGFVSVTTFTLGQRFLCKCLNNRLSVVTVNIVIGLYWILSFVKESPQIEYIVDTYFFKGYMLIYKYSIIYSFILSLHIYLYIFYHICIHI